MKDTQKISDLPADTGGSWGLNDEVVKATLRRTVPATVIDVGCGHGKYARMFAELGQRPKMIGVDAFAPTIEALNPLRLYDELHLSDVARFDWGRVGPVDMVIFGDVAEHLTREDFAATVKRIAEGKFAKYVLTVYPVGERPQEACGGNKYEEHKWSIDESDIERIFVDCGFSLCERHLEIATAEDGPYPKAALVVKLDI